MCTLSIPIPLCAKNHMFPLICQRTKCVISFPSSSTFPAFTALHTHFVRTLLKTKKCKQSLHADTYSKYYINICSNETGLNILSAFPFQRGRIFLQTLYTFVFCSHPMKNLFHISRRRFNGFVVILPFSFTYSFSFPTRPPFCN